MNTFIDINDVDANINFGFINLLCLLVFLLDSAIWITIPLVLKDPRCGHGLDWIAHYIVVVYLIICFFAENILVQFLFKKIQHKSSPMRYIIQLLRA